MKRKNESLPPNMARRKSGDIPATGWVCCPVCWRDHRRGERCKCGGVKLPDCGIKMFESVLDMKPAPDNFNLPDGWLTSAADNATGERPETRSEDA